MRQNLHCKPWLLSLWRGGPVFAVSAMENDLFEYRNQQITWSFSSSPIFHIFPIQIANFVAFTQFPGGWKDSVLNQFEHFLSLWRSHCAALGGQIPEAGRNPRTKAVQWKSTAGFSHVFFPLISGWWWLEPWNFMTFPYIGNVILPTDELIFFRGVGVPPTRYKPLQLI